MAEVIDKRVTAEIDGAFVVFLIGMRINKIWKAWKWLPIFAMPRMLRELEQRPEAGFLGASEYFGSPRRPMLVRFWRSFEHLETYARSRDAAHWPAWGRVQQARRVKRGCRHLALDLPRSRRRLPMHLQQHATHQSRHRRDARS